MQDTFEQANTVCIARDCMLIAWVCTHSPDWKDKRVTDLGNYRKHLLTSADEYEQKRSQLIGNYATPVNDLAEQMMSAMKRCPRDYLFGIAVTL